MARFTRDLLAAYCATEYRVSAAGNEFILRVGSISPELDTVLRDRGAESWAFITAWNPRSHSLGDNENAARQAELEAACRERGYQLLRGEGIGPSDPNGIRWREASLLILGIRRSDALELAQRFEQYAVLFGVRGEPARLLFSSPDKVGAVLREAAASSPDQVVSWAAKRALEEQRDADEPNRP